MITSDEESVPNWGALFTVIDRVAAFGTGHIMGLKTHEY